MQALPSFDTPDMWQRLKEEKRPIVIYGMGNGADKLIARLDSLGISFKDIFASDGFVRGHSFHGIRVKSFSEIKEAYPDFVILLSFGARIEEVIKMLEEIDSAYDLFVPDMPVSEEEVYFDSAFYKEHFDEINKALSALEDEESKNVFISIIRYKLSGRIKDLLAFTQTKEEMYSLLSPINPTRICDVGAYNGDTLKESLLYFKSLKSAVCIEPDKKTFNKLLLNCEKLENFTAVNCAVTGFDGEIGFSQEGGRQSAIGGSDVIKSMSLATLCEGAEPTFIKIDSEGCEKEILVGGKVILSEYKPKLNVAAYHKFEDVFVLSLLISEANPDYKIYLRHHPYIPAWDTLIYCV